MAHLVTKSKLVYCCCRIAAADDGCCIGICQSFCYCDRTCCQCRVFEYTHWSVPNNCFCCFYCICIQSCCFFSDIHSFFVNRDIIYRYVLYFDRSIDRVREICGNNCIYRKQKFFAKLLSFCHHLIAVVDLAVVYQRFTNLFALSFQECISHTAADDQSIAFLKQVRDNVQFVCYFCTTQDCNERANWIFYCIAQEINLFLHQISNNCGIYIFGNTYVRAVCSVSSTKCIVYEHITQRCQIFTECFAIFGFFSTVTSVFKQNNFSIFHSFYSCFCVRSYDFRISCKFYFLTKQFRETYCYRCQREFRFRFSLWFAQMRAKDYFSAVRDQFFDSWQSCYETVFVCDLAIFQRYVKVTADQDSFAFYVDIIN